MKDIVKKTLSNGIVAYLYPDKNMKRFIASYNVKYGSNGYYNKFYYKDKLYEVQPAMAHFLEHTLIEESKFGNMLFRFKEKNYETNGITYPNMTSYYFVGIRDTFESLKELIMMVDSPVFDKKSIENVKGAIMDEVTKNDYAKYQIGYRINKRNCHKNFEYFNESYNSLGSRDTTNAITYEDAKVCYDAFYNDENKFLIIGGNFKIDEMVEYLESIYKEIEPHPNLMREYDYGDEFGVRCEYQETVKEVDKDFAIVTYKFKDNYKMPNLLKSAYIYLFSELKFSDDTDFVTKLNNDKIISGELSTSREFFKNTITYTVSAHTLDTKAFIDKLNEEIKQLKFDERRFELLKKSMKVSEISKLEYKYYYLRKFCLSTDFTEKLFCIDTIDKINFPDFLKFVKTFDFSVKTVTVVRKDQEKMN